MPLPMSPLDSMFLLGESREHPMHVGGVEIFQLPEGADTYDMRAMLDRALADGDGIVTPRSPSEPTGPSRRSVSGVGRPSTTSTSVTTSGTTRCPPPGARPS